MLRFTFWRNHDCNRDLCGILPFVMLQGWLLMVLPPISPSCSSALWNKNLYGLKFKEALAKGDFEQAIKLGSIIYGTNVSKVVVCQIFYFTRPFIPTCPRLLQQQITCTSEVMPCHLLFFFRNLGS